MPDQGTSGSSVARFREPHGDVAWPPQQAIDALVRECARLLFAQCRDDPRQWLSEADLQGMFYALARRELAAHGLPPAAVHQGYPWRLPVEQARRLGVRSRTLPLAVILVAPHSIRPLRGRRWTADLAAAVELKRGYERRREIRAGLAKLAALRETRPETLTYLVVMGHHNKPEDVAAAERLARSADVPLLADNYWAREPLGEQPELNLAEDQ